MVMQGFSENKTVRQSCQMRDARVAHSVLFGDNLHSVSGNLWTEGAKNKQKKYFKEKCLTLLLYSYSGFV